MQRTRIAVDRDSARAQLGERGNRRLAQLLGLLLDARGRVDRASAQAALDVVDGRAREAGVRRAQEREELAAARVRPRVAQQLQQRVPERRRCRAARATRPRTGRRAPPSTVSSGARQRVERRRDERDLLGGGAGAEQLEQLVADELERAARAGALEEAHGAVELRAAAAATRRRASARDARAPGCAYSAERGGSSSMLPGGERREVVGGALRATRTRRGPARTAARPATSARPGERLEQRPLGAGQVLEAVREDRLAVPGVEVGLRAARRRGGAAGRGPRRPRRSSSAR